MYSLSRLAEGRRRFERGANEEYSHVMTKKKNRQKAK
jgi:hypothetical protein